MLYGKSWRMGNLKLVVPNRHESSQFFMFCKLHGIIDTINKQGKIWPPHANKIPILSIVCQLWPPEHASSTPRYLNIHILINLTTSSTCSKINKAGKTRSPATCSIQSWVLWPLGHNARSEGLPLQIVVTWPDWDHILPGFLWVMFH